MSLFLKAGLNILEVHIHKFFIRVLLSDITTRFRLRLYFMEETTCLSPLMSTDNLFFLTFKFIQGESLPKVEDCGHTGQLPGVNVYT